MARKKRIFDVTIRLRRRDGKPATDDEAKRALWAAHKIAQKGGSASAGLREWEIQAIDWQRRGGKKYHYEGGAALIDEVIANMGGLLESVGLDGLNVKAWRVGAPDDIPAGDE